MKKLSICLATLLAIVLSGELVAGQKVNYKVGKETFEGYFEKSKGKKSKGLVLIIHDWDGLTAYEKKRSQMLAAAGYDAFAMDLYGKGVRPVEAKMKKAETAKLYKDRKKMRNRILAGVKAAKKYSSKPAVLMGYCFGGAAVLELARSSKAPQIKGYATFHGGLATPPGQKYTKSAPIFIAHGGGDSYIPLEDVSKLAKQLEAAKIEYEVEIYSGAPHAFTVLNAPSYRKHADQKSWRSFMAFLQKNI